MSNFNDEDQITTIETLTEKKISRMTTRVSSNNQVVGGVSFSTETLQLHSFINSHNLLYKT